MNKLTDTERPDPSTRAKSIDLRLGQRVTFLFLKSCPEICILHK